MTKKSLMIAALAGTMLVAGCVTATPYQPYRDEVASGVHGGYSDERIGEDTFRVRFHGNDFASRDRVEGYMLYRAAELTLQNGGDWFLIVGRHTEHDKRTYVEPDPLYDPYYGPAYGWWQPHWRYSIDGTWVVWHPEYSRRFWTNDVNIRTVDSFEAEAEIVIRKGAIPAGEVRAFDARKVMADLGPTIERPKS